MINKKDAQKKQVTVKSGILYEYYQDAFCLNSWKTMNIQSEDEFFS